FAQNNSLNAKRSSSAFLRKSGRGLILFFTNQRQLFALYHCAVDRDFGNVFATWHIVHDVEHDALQQRTQRARACAFCDRLSSESAQRIFSHHQAHSLHREQLCVLLDHSVLCLGENGHHFFLRQGVE